MNLLKKLLFCCVLFTLSVLVTAEEVKNALLIANGDYARDMGALKEPIPEAKALKSALESIGFSVTLVQNADRDQMRRALKAFRDKTRSVGGIAFFHYGGHAMQIKGMNYLIPLQAVLEDEQDVAYNCVNVNDLMNSMEGDSNVVVLDSCRNNPFATSQHRGSDARGLAAIGVKPKNSIIVYAASEGHTAQDGIFTPILTKRITEKNRTFSDILITIRNDVRIKTSGKQNPGEYRELTQPIYLAGFDASAPVQQTFYTPPVRLENRDNIDDRTFSVNGVSFTMKPIVAVQGAVLGDDRQKYNQEHTVSLSAYYIGETEVTQELWEAVMGINMSCFTSSPKNPVEQVSWYDCITFCNELTAEVMGEEYCVYRVSGHSVTADFSKKGFRLPTEAEWEYAAMGKGNQKYAGCNQEELLEVYAWYIDNSGGETHEVGTKRTNQYGLYDMSGNVWEWCWDWYGSVWKDVNNPAGPVSGTYRVNRGGSWDSSAYYTLRVYREYLLPDNISNKLGLRIVCNK